jgi:hypothetical protein
MEVKRVNKKAVISFIIFIIAILKDILVSGLKIIPERGILNRSISWYFILPIIIVGTILSVIMIAENYKKKKNEGGIFFDINLILSLPTLLCFMYGVGSILFFLYACVRVRE